MLLTFQLNVQQLVIVVSLGLEWVRECQSRVRGGSESVSLGLEGGQRVNNLQSVCC